MINKNAVIEECLTELNQLRIKKYAYHSFETIVNKILDEINKVRNATEDEKEKTRLFHIWGNISHTLDKEVQYIRFAEERMKKKNAAKVRIKETSDAVDKACNQIYIDLLIF